MSDLESSASGTCPRSQRIARRLNGLAFTKRLDEGLAGRGADREGKSGSGLALMASAY